ncbi:ribbon-helix-helix protein, CopG family (plasmid) [Rhodococcus sp. ZPP]|uniref:ribbon-helix-helix protein, CopG family n=1 Tax=Rhodococcus sp. ZPP TaxID=2749906 RepID=UPI001AD89D31|nr:ribbon-helix-helix protein, CopG family [Rhodococcus sp. ZPP]MBO8150829.1 ribbon-helix-helix protein, CopG family [Rhodococcus erythropolis]QTJ70960.1 ribbon-helix-helix protein, CopG family [Rhodococcus sp. ZPP]QTJ70995.1 ribbon-helix-helix protein, CopG family [Rhodococcus sp. ZPP]
MSDGRARAGAAVYAQRVNAAAELLESGVPVAEAAPILAERFGCSVRQARRYADRAAEGGRAIVPEETTVFTVKLPAALAVRVREQARESGSTISALVAQALTEFLARGRRKPRRR